MIDSGKWFNDNPDNATEKELVDSAIKGLGLDYLKTFDPQVSIIEWALNKEVNNNE